MGFRRGCKRIQISRCHGTGDRIDELYVVAEHGKSGIIAFACTVVRRDKGVIKKTPQILFLIDEILQGIIHKAGLVEIIRAKALYISRKLLEYRPYFFLPSFQPVVRAGVFQLTLLPEDLLEQLDRFACRDLFPAFRSQFPEFRISAQHPCKTCPRMVEAACICDRSAALFSEPVIRGMTIRHDHPDIPWQALLQYFRTP